jgi:hypothetical protein
VTDDNLRVTITGAGQTVETTTDEIARLARGLTLPSAAVIASMPAGALYPVPGSVLFDHSDYIDAPDLEQIGEDLIARWPEFGFLEQVRIRYLWKAKGTSTAQAKCTRASGFWRWLSGIDFVIWVGASNVRESFYTREQVDGLLYHELSHIGWDESKGEPVTREHDAEIFFREFERYGIWSRAEAPFGQLALSGAFAHGEGLREPRYGRCNGCGAVIEFAQGCAQCIEMFASKPSVAQAPISACRSCGQVVLSEDAAAAPYQADGLCFECREQGAGL